MASREEKFAKGVLWVGSFEEAERRDREAWWAMTPFARLRSLQRMRELQHGYGTGKTRAKFQRVLQVTKRNES